MASLKDRLKEILIRDKHISQEDLEKALKDTMDYRNAFAHGDIVYETDQGCILTFWVGSSRREPLTDEYWESLESCFKKAHALVDKVITKMGEDLPKNK